MTMCEIQKTVRRGTSHFVCSIEKAQWKSPEKHPQVSRAGSWAEPILQPVELQHEWAEPARSMPSAAAFRRLGERGVQL